MISPPARGEAMALIKEAVQAGARQEWACRELGLSPRTVQRWRHQPMDGRPAALHLAPANKLSLKERQALLDTANSPRFASLTPHQIVPRLADENIYLASESTFYRVLKAAGQGARRGRSQVRRKHVITTHKADGPNQLWCWDITWMPSTVRGRFYYWYMMKDIYSRKLVVNEVYENESAENAGQLLARGCLREQTVGKPLVLHSDNGVAMKGANMLATMYELGVTPSYSRPRVSNDNAYAEALFKTAKYCPLWPERPFDTLEEARLWVHRFVHWYNEEHRHSSLKYVTPGQRHKGEAPTLLARRKTLYEAARTEHPERWSKTTRDWQLKEMVYLNPERDAVPHASRLAA